jgi:hypothetical protein
MWGKAKVKEMVEVRGTVRRFGIRPFDEVFRGYSVMLEGNDIPYILHEDVLVPSVRDNPSFLELTAPGDVISFRVEKGYRNGTHFRNESLAPELSRYLTPLPAAEPAQQARQ